MRLLRISKAILQKEYKELFRYKIQLVSGIIFLVVMLLGFVYGGMKLSGSRGNEQVVLNLLSGFLIFFITNACIGTPSNECSSATNEGNMETVAMFSVSLEVYLTIKTFIHILVTIGAFFLVTWIVSMLLKVAFFSNNMLILIPFYIVSIFGGLGLGLFFAGLQLLYKKISYVVSLTAIGISFLLSYLPPTTSILVEMIPMKAFSSMLKHICIEKTTPQSTIMILTVVGSIFFYILGVFLFQKMVRKAKDKGRLGVY